MATRKTTQQTSGVAGLAGAISLKDLITIISFAVSMALAWGAFSTRLAIIERELVSVKAQNDQQADTLQQIQVQLRKLEAREQDDQQFIDELFRMQRRMLPRRSTN